MAVIYALLHTPLDVAGLRKHITIMPGDSCNAVVIGDCKFTHNYGKVGVLHVFVSIGSVFRID